MILSVQKNVCGLHLFSFLYWQRFCPVPRNMPIRNGFGPSSSISVKLQFLQQPVGIQAPLNFPINIIAREQVKKQVTACSQMLFRLDEIEARYPGIIVQWILHYLEHLKVDKFVFYDSGTTAWKYLAQVPEHLRARLVYEGNFAERFGHGESIRHQNCQCIPEHLVYNHCLHRHSKSQSKFMMLVYGLDEWLSPGLSHEKLRQDTPISDMFNKYEDILPGLTALHLQRYDHSLPENVLKYDLQPAGPEHHADRIKEELSYKSNINNLILLQNSSNSCGLDNSCDAVKRPSWANQWERWFFDDIALSEPGLNRALIVNTERAQQLTTHQAAGFYATMDDNTVEVH